MKVTARNPWKLVAIVGALSLACACMAETRKDSAPESAPEAAAAKPPKPGEPFYELGEVPKGPPTLKDINPALIGAPAEVYAEVEGAPTDPGEGRISRRSLIEFIKEGPRHPLSLVEVQPAFKGAQFIGYRIVAFSTEGARDFGSALKQGDVVVEVNDRPIARPEQYMAVWEGLPRCKNLSVSVLRDGEKVEMSWPVID